jgi:GNAT superfamily N-acetyltransferase
MSDSLTLRRAVLADAGAVRALTRQAYAKWVPLIGREPKPMQADYEKAVRQHFIDLAYVGDVLAGLIEMIALPDHLLIENVAVAPAFQGRGIGRALMAHAERLAVTLHHREVRLYTNQAFAENVALYLKLGYGIDRRERLAIGVAVHMSKAVA